MGFWLILLTILKIIGIIIASVLVLLLLIASLVLFVPIRYGGKVGFHGKPDISVRVTYLLKMISARFEMHEMPTVLRPQWFAAIASQAVDIPTASAPRVRTMRISAGDS